MPFSAETFILTEDGQIPICELDELPVKIWNGASFANASVLRGNPAPIWSVETSDGCVLNCSADHRFLCQDGSVVLTSDLIVGNELNQSTDFPLIDKREAGKWYDEPRHNELAIENVRKYDRFMEKMTLFNNASFSIIERDEFWKYKLMMQTCGVNMRIVNSPPKALVMMARSNSESGRNDIGNYYEAYLSDSDKIKLQNICATQDYKISLCSRLNSRTLTDASIKIVSVTNTDTTGDTYSCIFAEEENQPMCVADGLYTFCR